MSIDEKLRNMKPSDTPLLVVGYVLLGMMLLLGMPANAQDNEVLIDQAMSSGKPKEIAEKMVQGRLQKFFQEVVLNEQTSVIDGETKIKDIINR